MTSMRTALLALLALGAAFNGVSAQGRGHGGGRGGGGGGYVAAGRGGYAPRGGYDAPRGYAPPFRGDAPAPYERGPFGRGRETSYPDGAPYTPSQTFRRGQYIPHAYWSAAIANPKSRHLRTPPPGYGWVGFGRDAYLMQRSTGLVLDSVPGAW